MTARPIFLLVFKTLYTFKDPVSFPKTRISDLLMNESFRNSFESYMQIEKDQWKINFCILGPNFGRNLHLAISLRIIQF